MCSRATKYEVFFGKHESRDGPEAKEEVTVHVGKEYRNKIQEATSVIYLIGGSSHTGKTLLAQKLMERTGIPYTSLDHLKMGFIRAGMTELTVEDDEAMCQWMWPFVSGMIRTAIENEQNMILEGCYIPAEWKESFSEEELRNIRCMFLVMSETYIRENFSDIEKYANVIEKRLCDQLDMEQLIKCSEGFQRDCEKHGILCFVIDEKYCVEDMLHSITAQ